MPLSLGLGFKVRDIVRVRFRVKVKIRERIRFMVRIRVGVSVRVTFASVLKCTGIRNLHLAIAAPNDSGPIAIAGMIQWIAGFARQGAAVGDMCGVHVQGR